VLIKFQLNNSDGQVYREFALTLNGALQVGGGIGLLELVGSLIGYRVLKNYHK